MKTGAASLFFSSAKGCPPVEWEGQWEQWGVSYLDPLMVVGTCPCGQAWGLQAWMPQERGSFIIIIIIISRSSSSSKRRWEAA